MRFMHIKNIKNFLSGIHIFLSHLSLNHREETFKQAIAAATEQLKNNSK